MKRITIAYVVLVMLPTILWAIAEPIWSVGSEFFAIRASLIQYTGVVAIATMGAAMILALRLVSIEPLLGGLDRSYRLHKWLGVTGFVFSILHFLLANVPKLLAGAGWLDEPARESSVKPMAGFLGFFQRQHAFAEECGDWGFKFAVVLTAIALIRWFPYRFFTRSHRLLSLVFVFLAFHSVALMRFSYWDHAIAPLVAILSVGGSVAAVISLLGQVGSAHRAVGEIERIEYLEDNSVLKLGIRLKSRWAGHQEGQFAFVTFDRREGAHPFTIATPWTGDGTVSFFIKGLGDYTRTLPTALDAGDLVTVEGPYGEFDFRSKRTRQIWVAGGIGIAPFAARIKALIEEPSDMPVDFFYSASRSDDDAFLDRISSASAQAKIQLHIVRTATEGRLDAKRICETIPEWREADVWFCGPTAFGESLRKELVSSGLPPNDFHHELFEMR